MLSLSILPPQPPQHSAAHTGRIARFACAALTLLAVGGCSTSQYPSLERRPAEMLAPPEVAQTHAPAPAPLAQALAAKLEDITARAHAADLAFHAAQAPARRQCAAALGAAPGSVEWGAANDAIAVLDGQRAATAFALADIEQIYTDDRIAHALEDGASGEPGARPTAAAIAQTRAAIIAIIAREDGVMRELSAQLKG